MRKAGMILVTAGTLMTSNLAGADENRELPRLSIFGGAGTGYLQSKENAVPFRINGGIEYFFKAFPHISVGYMFALPVATDQVSFSGGSQTVRRMIHFFPRFRCFLFSRDYALGGLSVNLAPGIAMQHLSGGMMGSGQGSASFTSIAASGSLEYNFKLEEKIQLGIEGGADYIAPVRGTVGIPRTLIWTGSANLHFFIGS